MAAHEKERCPMNELALKVGFFQHDTTRALFDKSITIDGVDATWKSATTIPEIFQRMMRDRDFDFAELGLTFYLRTLDLDSPFIAIPVFPNRVFRHSCVFVNTESGITEPKNLAGKTIGEFGIYGQDSGVRAKGILMDEYGFKPEESRWVIGGLDRPMPPFDFVSHPHPANVEVTVAPQGKALSSMLDAGEIDALFTANVPQCVLDESPHVTRLFPSLNRSNVTTTYGPAFSQSCTPSCFGENFSTHTLVWRTPSIGLSSRREMLPPTATGRPEESTR